MYFNEQDAMLDLSGFDSLITIGSRVRIWDNTVLSSLEGLNNVELIGGNLDINHNDSLVQINALDNLNTIGGNLILSKNETLDNIESLSLLMNFNGEIMIYQNTLLTSLDGIENIEADSITNLYLAECASLSICSQPNICQYLINSLGPSTINLNNSGCNSVPEITAACSSIVIDELTPGEQFLVFPNPSEGIINIQTDNSIGTSIKIYNTIGEMVFSDDNLKPNSSIQLHQSPGLYLVVLKTSYSTATSKLILK